MVAKVKNKTWMTRLFELLDKWGICPVNVEYTEPLRLTLQKIDAGLGEMQEVAALSGELLEALEDGAGGAGGFSKEKAARVAERVAKFAGVDDEFAQLIDFEPSAGASEPAQIVEAFENAEQAPKRVKAIGEAVLARVRETARRFSQLEADASELLAEVRRKLEALKVEATSWSWGKRVGTMRAVKDLFVDVKKTIEEAKKAASALGRSNDGEAGRQQLPTKLDPAGPDEHSFALGTAPTRNRAPAELIKRLRAELAKLSPEERSRVVGEAMRLARQTGSSPSSVQPPRRPAAGRSSSRPEDDESSS